MKTYCVQLKTGLIFKTTEEAKFETKNGYSNKLNGVINTDFKTIIISNFQYQSNDVVAMWEE